MWETIVDLAGYSAISATIFYVITKIQLAYRKPRPPAGHGHVHLKIEEDVVTGHLTYNVLCHTDGCEWAWTYDSMEDTRAGIARHISEVHE